MVQTGKSSPHTTPPGLREEAGFLWPYLNVTGELDPYTCLLFPVCGGDQWATWLIKAPPKSTGLISAILVLMLNSCQIVCILIMKCVDINMALTFESWKYILEL